MYKNPPSSVLVSTLSVGPCFSYCPIKSPSFLNKLSEELNEPFTSFKYITNSAPSLYT